MAFRKKIYPGIDDLHLGSREEAERWMVTLATVLDQRRPIDLLSTPAGTVLVEEFLDRLDYGVYA